MYVQTFYQYLILGKEKYFSCFNFTFENKIELFCVIITLKNTLSFHDLRDYGIHSFLYK